MIIENKSCNKRRTPFRGKLPVKSITLISPLGGTFMDLDFQNHQSDLFTDWRPNQTKKEFTQKLQQQAQAEKAQLPRLLTRDDLKKRWDMNSRQSVHQVASKRDFPAPVYAFNQGKTLLYLESEIQIYEINHPWIITPADRFNYSQWIFENVINSDD